MECEMMQPRRSRSLTRPNRRPSRSQPPAPARVRTSGLYETLEGRVLMSATSNATTLASIGPKAPPLDATIEGINFDFDNENSAGFYHIPADPSGAAGPDHVVSVVQSSIEWHTKAGVEQESR